MKVLLLGSTGYIGRVITGLLQSRGHQLTDMPIDEAEFQQVCGAGIRPVRGSLEDLSPLHGLAKEADAVIYESEAFILRANRNKTDASKLDESVIETLLAALKGSGKPFLYTSGAAFIGDTRGILADETAPVDPQGPLAWRWLHEQRILDPANGVRGVAIRPPFMHGRGGGGMMLLNLLSSAKRQRAAMMIGDGANRWSTVHVDDLADLYVRALEQAPAGQVFFAASPEKVTLREVAEAASHAAGAGGKVLPVPLTDARNTVGPMADMSTWNITVSGEKAHRLLGWLPTHPGLLEDLTQGSYVPRPPLIQTPAQRHSVVMPGEMFTFLARNKDTGGAYALMEVAIAPDGGPPPHFHDDIEESFYVLEGELEFSVGAAVATVNAGSYVNIPKGTVHHFHNASANLCRIATLVIPGGMDDYFEAACIPSDGQPSSIPASSELPHSPALKLLQELGPKYGVIFLPPVKD